MRAAARTIAAWCTTLLLVSNACADGDPARGEARFQECAACHKLDAGANGLGPSLHGIFERKAGELSDFRYSPALRRSGIVWSPQTLEAYLTDPQALVPGNRMPYAGMADPRDRADLIAYLAKMSR
jgi:cytochrome c2